MNKQESTQWPKVAVEFWDNRPRQIMSREEAAEKFGLQLDWFDWLNDEMSSVSGKGLSQSERGHKIARMLHRYTAKECAEDAAMEMLAALEEVLPEIQRLNEAAGHTVFNPTATSMVKEAIAKATMNP